MCIFPSVHLPAASAKHKTRRMKPLPLAVPRPTALLMNPLIISHFPFSRDAPSALASPEYPPYLPHEQTCWIPPPSPPHMSPDTNTPPGPWVSWHSLLTLLFVSSFFLSLFFFPFRVVHPLLLLVYPFIPLLLLLTFRETYFFASIFGATMKVRLAPLWVLSMTPGDHVLPQRCATFYGCI